MKLSAVLITTLATLQSSWATDFPYTGANSGLNMTPSGSDGATTGDKFILTDFSAYFHNFRDNADQREVLADIELIDGDSDSNAVTITNGWPHATHILTFSGAITGSGDWFHNWSNNLNWLFAGDVSAYTGNFKFPDNGHLIFGNGGVGVSGSVTGSGSINTNNDLTFDYSNDVMSASDISGAGAIIWKGTGTLTLTGNITNTGTNSTPNGGTIVLAGPTGPTDINEDFSTWADDTLVGTVSTTLPTDPSAGPTVKTLNGVDFISAGAKGLADGTVYLETTPNNTNNGQSYSSNSTTPPSAEGQAVYLA